jgi:hypothetical protein
MITIRKDKKKGYIVRHSQEGDVYSSKSKTRAKKIADRLRKEKSQMYGYFYRVIVMAKRYNIFYEYHGVPERKQLSIESSSRDLAQNIFLDHVKKRPWRKLKSYEIHQESWWG